MENKPSHTSILTKPKALRSLIEATKARIKKQKTYDQSILDSFERTPRTTVSGFSWGKLVEESETTALHETTTQEHLDDSNAESKSNIPVAVVEEVDAESKMNAPVAVMAEAVEPEIDKPLAPITQVSIEAKAAEDKLLEKSMMSYDVVDEGWKNSYSGNTSTSEGEDNHSSESKSSKSLEKVPVCPKPKKQTTPINVRPVRVKKKRERLIEANTADVKQERGCVERASYIKHLECVKFQKLPWYTKPWMHLCSLAPVQLHGFETQQERFTETYKNNLENIDEYINAVLEAGGEKPSDGCWENITSEPQSEKEGLPKESDIVDEYGKEWKRLDK